MKRNGIKAVSTVTHGGSRQNRINKRESQNEVFCSFKSLDIFLFLRMHFVRMD